MPGNIWKISRRIRFSQILYTYITRAFPWTPATAATGLFPLTNNSGWKLLLNVKRYIYMMVMACRTVLVHGSKGRAWTELRPLEFKATHSFLFVFSFGTDFHDTIGRRDCSSFFFFLNKSNDIRKIADSRHMQLKPFRR